MAATPLTTAPIDRRIWIYRQVKRGVLLFLILFIVKIFVIDTIHIATDQMQPTISPGDQVLLWKLPFAPSWPHLFKPHPNTVVVIKDAINKRHTCQRIVAVAGDTVAISNGMLKTRRPRIDSMHHIPYGMQALPPSYSPRDTMEAYCIPRKGEYLELDTLSLRDFFFSVAMIRAENSHNAYTIVPEVFINGTPLMNPPLADFSLFPKPIKDVPDSLAFNYFFWDRMKAYLSSVYNDKTVTVIFSLFEGKTKLFRYHLKESYIFLLADDWCNGYDSRYTGPAKVSSISGQVVCVLWSHSPQKKGIAGIRFNRLLRFIR